MDANEEMHIVASPAKIITMMCVRNTKREDIHAEVVPVSKTGEDMNIFKSTIS